MRKHILILFAAIISLILAGSCTHKEERLDENSETAFVDNTIEIKGDSMLYGLSCDGSSDSVVVIWPFSGDPLTFNIIDAKENSRIIGKPEIGDWIGIMIDPEDSTSAAMVINLDEIKGTWTYPVMPVMKELQNMSKRAQRRMMANIHDSIKNNYMIPREYGFTLKRSHNAQAVGRVMRSNTLEDDSPVKYPDVKNYKKWYMLNGRLVLISGAFAVLGSTKAETPKDVLDTFDIVSLNNDSLILMQHGIRYGFHRKQNAMEANKEAQKKEDRK